MVLICRRQRAVLWLPLAVLPLVALLAGCDSGASKNSRSGGARPLAASQTPKLFDHHGAKPAHIGRTHEIKRAGYGSAGDEQATEDDAYYDEENATEEEACEDENEAASGDDEMSDGMGGGEFVTPAQQDQQPNESRLIVKDQTPIAQPNGAADADVANEPPTQSNAPSGDWVELPWARVRAASPEMSAVVYRADQAVRSGLSLGTRGALYSARAEFLQALRLLAQAQDTQQETSMYGEGLVRGMAALVEAEDFITRDSSTQAIDVPFLVASHRTSILQQGRAVGFTPMAAQGRYYTYAQEQLAMAAGKEVVGSMALYGLGKVTASMGSRGKGNTMEFSGKAMAYYQAALISNPNNFRAAHELGVLLAQNGRLEQARDMFLRVVVVSPNPVTWSNLAAVHDRLGEPRLAAAAREEQKLSQSNDKATPKPLVQWVEPNAFASSASSTDGVAAPSPASKAMPKTDKPSGISAWLPWTKKSQK